MAAVPFSSSLGDWTRLARPKDWIKNVFIVLPVPFAIAAGARLEPLLFLVGVGAFCLGASAVYAFNDAADAERDRLDPSKSARPVASGRVAVAGAYWFAGILAALSLLVSFAANGRGAAIVLAGYLALNVAYSVGGKHVALVDVFLLSAGFVLRVVFGCALLAVAPSNWLLLCSSMLALFLALAKRRADLGRGLGHDQRPSLAGYTMGFLDQAMGIAAGTTIIAYAIYCIEAENLVPGREFAGLPFVIFGVLEYLRVAQIDGTGSSPVDTLLSSPLLVTCGIAWTGVTIWSVPRPW